MWYGVEEQRLLTKDERVFTFPLAEVRHRVLLCWGICRRCDTLERSRLGASLLWSELTASEYHIRGGGGGFPQSGAAPKHRTLGNEKDVYSAEGLAYGESRGMGTVTAWWGAVQGSTAEASAWLFLPFLPCPPPCLPFLFQCWEQKSGTHICLGKCWSSIPAMMYLKLTNAVTGSAFMTSANPDSLHSIKVWSGC